MQCNKASGILVDDTESDLQGVEWVGKNGMTYQGGGMPTKIDSSKLHFQSFTNDEKH